MEGRRERRREGWREQGTLTTMRKNKKRKVKKPKKNSLTENKLFQRMMNRFTEVSLLQWVMSPPMNQSLGIVRIIKLEQYESLFYGSGF